ncbi:MULTISPECIES: hypothetical protein [unclassified Streptomyces]|uniref:hypothetical protein n=1 Tax=unclassified Streptomyces TaxID=2593676 RepID=UPI003432B064
MLALTLAPQSAASTPSAKGDFQIAVEQGLEKSWKIDKKEFQEARKQAGLTKSSGDEQAAKTDKREKFLSSSAKNHFSYTSEEVDVVSLLDGAVQVAIPADLTLDSVTVSLDEKEVNVEAAASNSGEDVPTLGGPGMGEWENDGSGQYNIYVTGLGEAQFLWKREKATDDGSSVYDYYSYSRMGIARPYDLSGEFDARVSVLRIQSYPYDEIESGLVNWEDLKPAISFEGNCDSTPLNVSVTAPFAGVGYSFQDCDEYEVWSNLENPGSYHMTMNQGVILSGGDREAAYTLAIKVKEGTPGSMHDFQRVTFNHMGTSFECSVFDSGATCPGS